MVRLPVTGQDENTWGDILNEYLLVEHYPDGTLRKAADIAAKAPSANPTFTGAVTVPTPSNSTDAATKNYVDTKTFTKSDVGLGNVDNVQQMPMSYLDTDGTLAANSDTKVASQKATKTYADTKMAKAGGTYTGAVNETPVVLTDGASIAVNATLGNIFAVTLGGNRTISNPTGATSGQKLIFRLKQDGAGSRTVTWDTKFRWSASVAQPVLATTGNAVDYVSFIYNAEDDKFDAYNAAGVAGANGSNGAAGSAAAGVIASTATTAATATVPISTTQEVTVWSGTIPANKVVAGDVLDFSLEGDLLVSTASAGAVFRLKLGSSTVLAATSMSLSASVNRKKLRTNAHLVIGSTTAQVVGGSITVATATTSNWQLFATGSSLVGVDVSAVDTSSDRALSLTIEYTTTTGTADARVVGASIVHTQAVPNLPVTVTATTAQMNAAVAAGITAANNAASTTEVAYAERTTSVTTTGTTDVGTLAATVPPNQGRPMRVVVQALLSHSAVDGKADIYLNESVNGGSYSIIANWEHTVAAAGAKSTKQYSHRIPDSANTRDYKVTLRTVAASGTATLTADATRVAFMHIYQL